MIDWNLIGVILAWTAGIVGVLFAVCVLMLSVLLGVLDKLDSAERAEDEFWWLEDTE